MSITWRALLVVLTLATAVWAAEPARPSEGKKPTPGPEELTRTSWNAVLAVLRDPKLDVRAKGVRIEKIVTPIMDFPLMAKLALGRTHWRRFTPAQRKTYSRLFTERLKSSYRDRIAKHQGQAVRFGARPGAKDKKPAPAGKARSKKIARVPLQLVAKDSTVAILHKFRKAGEGWKIYDIEIEGVSILLTYRSQFNDILNKGKPEDLLKRLGAAPSD